jgi:hypothetical protein
MAQNYIGIKAFCDGLVTEDYRSLDPELYWSIPHQASSVISHGWPSGNRDHHLPNTPANTPPNAATIALWKPAFNEHMAKLEGTFAYLTAPAVTDIDLDDVVYTLGVRGEKLRAVELEFTVQGDMVTGKSVTGLNGFSVASGIHWTPLMTGNLWKGSVTLGYDGAGVFGTGMGVMDIAEFAFNPLKAGNSAMKIVSFRAVGLEGTNMVDMYSYIAGGTATTSIEVVPKYGPFDFNRDGVVDLLDLAIALLYVGYDSTHADWNGPGYKVVDVHKVPIYAFMCDVAPLGVGDNKVDMADVLEVYINYT